jgi:hypothetical protein
MSDVPDQSRETIVRGEGVTQSERYLGKLCRRSFLSLWSYPGVYRDQGKRTNNADGKELCDLLVVFENHIILFSDKRCEFGHSGNLGVDWSRWFKRAVQEAAKQIWGAERWIRGFPGRIFLDRSCTFPFPISFPPLNQAVFHRIVVAHGASDRCRQELGGRGSLMLNSRLAGDEHLIRPFTIGQIDVNRGFVHVFDDTTLDIMLGTLDTISDFTHYLSEKEKTLQGNTYIVAAGEEDLLAAYYQGLNKSGEHDFGVFANRDMVVLAEGLWDEFVASPERKSQIENDAVSYVWDELIEKFSFHTMTGTEYFKSGRPLKEQEKSFRFLAREPRTRRRGLINSLSELLERSANSASAWDARLVISARKQDPLYVFLAAKRKPGVSDDDYRNYRVRLLSDYCHVAKHKHPEALDALHGVSK